MSTITTIISIIVGAAITLIPNIVAYKINFCYSNNKKKLLANTIVKKFYLAEITKFLLMILLFTAAIISGKLQHVTLFVAFIITQLLWWLVSSRVLLRSC